MIDATYVKAYRTARSLHAKKGLREHQIAHRDRCERSTDRCHITGGQVSRSVGVTALLNSLPKSE
ncbi:hypothetical protein [Paracoccus hibiscisoli]|uniref:Transposase n=1 Tax=Paracoccus hibiscisoli TaxID=2023261 RepID=A0A4U0QSZ5_9RHOB|nr:hypothetical protein [Paracoccus hibiscisoli]TJZ85179.1 hypothetical protein FA740_07520 [Paracoccus hibiscisoli]